MKMIWREYGRSKIISLVSLIALIIGIVCFFHGRDEEIYPVSALVSSDGSHKAIVQMKVYGDHWFVNTPMYEIFVEGTESTTSRSLVYSVEAGDVPPYVRWAGPKQLEIHDTNRPGEGVRLKSVEGVAVTYSD